MNTQIQQKKPSSGEQSPGKATLPRWAALLVIMGAFCAICPKLVAQAQEEKPVAVVKGQKIYEKDFVPQLEGQLYKIRQEEYELKLRALEERIGRMLLHDEAQKHGVSDEEWLRQTVDSKVEDPTQEEIDQQFAAQMFQQVPQAPQNIDEITKQLKEQTIQEARAEYFEGLRAAAGVKIYLLPPAIDVAYDPARVRGNPGAKITMIEFSDFQCPYCLQAYSMVKELLKKYDGKVKLAYRDLPLQEINGGVAGSADAARCAGEQGKFWEYHDLLFENQDSAGPEAFKEFAEDLKLNPDQFASCLKSGKYKAQIKADYQEALRLGITGTPAFFINGVLISGARPKAEFENIIDTELALMQQ